MKPSPLSRRELLNTSLSAASVAALASCGKNLRAQDDSGQLSAASIEHVIFIMLENRSFDHVLGSRLLLEGQAVNGLVDGMSNTANDGTAYPIAPSAISCVNSPPHSWTSSRAQLADGGMSGFVTEYEASGAGHPGEVMGYLTRAEVPVTSALADQYLACDAWFCSVMGPTWPNRMYANAGTSDGQKDNAFPEGGAFTFPTLWSHLDTIDVPWMYYYFDLPFIGLFAGALRDGFHGLLDDFVRDCEQGSLKPVSWIDPGFSFNDDHPPHHVGLGQEFLAAIFEALGKSPLWEKCLVVFTYDEHGGFFDHVVPPTCADDHADEGFDQLGFRVPALVVGPWVKQGVATEIFDHTSWLKYLCDSYGIEPWTLRIASSNSIAACIDTDRMARNEPLPPPVLPGMEIVDEDALGSECFGGGLGPTPPPASAHHSGQPKLEAFIQKFHPRSDQTARGLAQLERIREGIRARVQADDLARQHALAGRPT